MSLISLDKVSDILVAIASAFIISYLLRIQIPFVFRIDYLIRGLPIDKIFKKSQRSESIFLKDIGSNGFSIHSTVFTKRKRF